MTIFDGTDAFAGSKGISSDRMNKTVLWRGTTLPENPDNEVPVDGVFLKTDDGKFFRNTGDVINPVWELIPAGAITGEIRMYSAAIAAIPFGFLLCDGAAISRTTFSELFALIGTTYGVGDGSTTFNIPDFTTNNKFPRAATGDGQLGDTGGESTHTLSTAEMPSHTHVQDPHNHDSVVDTAGVLSTVADHITSSAGDTDVTTAVNQNTGGGGSHENKPPFIDIHFIIAT